MSKLRVELYKIIVKYKNNKGDFPINQKREKEQTTDLLEQITDDFSVKLLEWKDKLQLESKIGLMDRGFSVYMESGKDPISVTTTELLQIFKEKYYE